MSFRCFGFLYSWRTIPHETVLCLVVRCILSVSTWETVGLSVSCPTSQPSPEIRWWSTKHDHLKGEGVRLIHQLIVLEGEEGLSTADGPKQHHCWSNARFDIPGFWSWRNSNIPHSVFLHEISYVLLESYSPTHHDVDTPPFLPSQQRSSSIVISLHVNRVWKINSSISQLSCYLPKFGTV